MKKTDYGPRKEGMVRDPVLSWREVISTVDGSIYAVAHFLTMKKDLKLMKHTKGTWLLSIVTDY